MKCSNCQFENPADAGFCIKCGEPLRSPEDIPTISHTKTLHPIKELTRGGTFANRYEVIEELGRGGMGRVYRVFDKKIGEEVALKLLKPEIASDERTIERFRNELRLARKIAHRNVCRMYDLSEEYGAHYITMEYVPGENLKGMIRMTRQLSATQAVFIAKQVCEGLAEAHRLGVVHRDLKPQNIIIDREGNARIMDFGIARSTKDRGITGVGVMIGTPEYMPPEQVEGKEADQRSDIYSLGVIMYEMVTGRLPFEGDSSLSISLKHKTERPLDPRKFNAQVPEALSRVILKCLEKDMERRFQDSQELFSELSKIEEGISTVERFIPKGKTAVTEGIKEAFRKRWKMIAALFMAVVLAGVVILYFRGRRQITAPGETMLVVLPFNNLGPPEDEYFADGITEEITNRLAALSGLGVISRTSAIQYKNTNKTIRTIGEELAVDYVLEGAVRWNRSEEGRGRVRITPQLIRVTDDTHLWANNYDRVIEDIFSVQSEIAEEVARQLDLSVLTPERTALNARPTDNLEAYDYFLRGQEQTARGVSRADFKEHELGIQLLQKATELDPNFTLAYVSMAQAHSWAYFTGWDQTEERLTKSKNALDRALELQPNIPQVRQTLATYYYRGLLDFDRAAEILESIQRERPNFNPQLLGFIQRRHGKWEQALETLERASRLNPRDSALAYEIAGASISMRSYEQADVWISRSLSIDPNRLQPQIQKAGIYVLAEGNTEEARALLETAPEHPLTDYMWFTVCLLERRYQEVLDWLSSLSYDSFEEQHFYFEKNLAYATVYHAMREQTQMKTHAESARIILEKLLRDRPQDPRYHTSLGLAYAYLEQKDRAIQEGNRATQLYPVSKDAAQGPIYVLNLARIYTVVGEYEEAIDRLEYMLYNPTAEYLWQLITIPVLQLDPQWDPLRENPRFKRLLQRN
jgi:TolB-like protein/Flp pilus assembly protein TadD/predicted Ser/Thr protein kinase